MLVQIHLQSLQKELNTYIRIAQSVGANVAKAHGSFSFLVVPLRFLYGATPRLKEHPYEAKLKISEALHVSSANDRRATHFDIKGLPMFAWLPKLLCTLLLVTPSGLQTGLQDSFGTVGCSFRTCGKLLDAPLNMLLHRHTQTVRDSKAESLQICLGSAIFKALQVAVATQKSLIHPNPYV